MKRPCSWRWSFICEKNPEAFEKFEAAHLNAVDKYMKLNNIGLGKSETKTVKVA